MSISLTPGPDGLYTLCDAFGGRTRTYVTAPEFIEQTLGADEFAALAPEQLIRLAQACRDAAVPHAEDLVYFSPPV
ncbi:hypothetical protein EV683_12715 [Crenobacter luteus]|uniref:Uncharacterized protein n=1 Tax=Crenobacter luteus TaxID=1452487 RepID=A0A163DFS2_9NEIS|nr:hypothetical protein [Crenobacter luteus]KZE34586.1 hypothetical protein AVW16_06075 [Crenobacter luteus]TCP09412.1 hypothetical protein EV683_12715 [Crenobacter luteus]